MTTAQIDFAYSLGYLLAAVLFIFGLKQMAHPRTAVRGNLLGAAGMLLAVVIALLGGGLHYPPDCDRLGSGRRHWRHLCHQGADDLHAATVALFNGFGGAASVLVAGAALHLSHDGGGAALGSPELVATGLSGIIGAVTFLGSLIAFGKLQELALFRSRSISRPADRQ